MSLCFSFPSVKRGIAVANLVRIQLRNASTMPSATWPGVRCQQMLGALPSAMPERSRRFRAANRTLQLPCLAENPRAGARRCEF